MFKIDRTKAIVFGAGEGGRKLTEYLEHAPAIYIVAYSDNNPKLHGAMLFGKPVIHPSSIRDYAYDRIFIATMDTYNVTKQLVEQLNIPLFSIDSNTFIDHVYNVENQPRINSLRYAAKLIYGMQIQGAVAELGVFQGEFAKHINEYFPDRQLYLFDTFSGFPPSDVEKEIELLGTGVVVERNYNFLSVDTELVLSKMKHRDRCVVKKGYFPATAHSLESDFAFVSLDTDLYQPILEGLKYFYPRMSTGGMILIHDYFSEELPGVALAVSEFRKNTNVPLVPIGDNCSVMITKI